MTELEEALSGIFDELHKIVNPGEYGLGQEPESIPNDDKAAWVRVGILIEQAIAAIGEQRLMDEQSFELLEQRRQRGDL
jgi:hypothetical protein